MVTKIKAPIIKTIPRISENENCDSIDNKRDSDSERNQPENS